jgi:predicted nuclease of predicted toxin-antitoxin system
MARLLADENFPRPVVIELRQLGHDAAELSELGLAHLGTRDSAVLEAASASGRAVLTFDRRDYVALHRASREHAGIVACTYDPDFVRLAARIDAALSGIEDLRGQLVRVVRPGPTGI